MVSTANNDKIISSDTPDRGWYSNSDNSAVRLWRDSHATAEEGVFTCNITFGGDINALISVGIYYHSESTAQIVATLTLDFYKKVLYQRLCSLEVSTQ